jgi:hypothetical protein
MVSFPSVCIFGTYRDGVEGEQHIVNSTTEKGLSANCGVRLVAVQ